MMNSPNRTLVAVPVALVGGMVGGWLDVTATNVQGPLLILMLAAFVIALLTRAPAWAIALAVTAGLPLAHLVAGADVQWGMLIALIPLLIAAYSGNGLAALVGRSSSTLTASSSPSGEWYERAVSPAVLLSSALLACAIIGAAPVYATLVARGQPITWWVATWWQIVSFVAWALATPIVLRLWRSVRRDDAQGVTATELATHAVVIVAIALVHAIVMPLLTRLLLVPLGPGGIGRAAAWAFAAYLPLDALTYALVVGLGHASDTNRRARAADARESAVRGELAAARLASLRAQLRPHFLFNALNAATVLTRQGDSDRASRVLSGLAELLRYVLRGTDEAVASELVRLDDEITFAESYLAIERERFPDRLETVIDVPTEMRQALVPHLLLQPLVENAVRHGIGARLGSGKIIVRAWRTDARLHVTVEDNGPGPNAATGSRGEKPSGIGLANTRVRLATIYKGDATLELMETPAGGAKAHVTLPFAE